MVAEAPEQLREAALQYFREEELPEALWWVADLNPLQLRLFAVELSDTLKTALITGDDRPAVPGDRELGSDGRGHVFPRDDRGAHAAHRRARVRAAV